MSTVDFCCIWFIIKAKVKKYLNCTERKNNMTFIEEKIKISIQHLASHINSGRKNVENIYIVPTEYKKENTPPSENAAWELYDGQAFEAPDIDRHYWFKFEIDVPEVDSKHECRLCTSSSRDNMWCATNPQCTVFIDDTTAYQAFDTHHLFTPVKPGHHNVYIYYYTGMASKIVDISFFTRIADLEIEDLYYDLTVAEEAMRQQDKNSDEYLLIRSYLNKATMMLDFRYTYSDDYFAGIRAASKYMKEEFYGKECGKTRGEIDYIGHTHIDVAWLWSLAQSREKAQRSFSTVMRLMEKYPDYIFQSSQPQLYEFVKESDPVLYEKIKQKAAEGRWEVEGAMWLESDTNLVSGESLIRQILLGKRFMRDEFGVESKLLWLPDVFGYSAALPQILKKSGVPFFFTTKLSWSETNKFPYDNFIWRGIDGSEVFAVLSESYVRNLDAAVTKNSWRYHSQKEYTSKTISTFGYGDGGGGPTPEMLEKYDRLKHGLPGLPAVKMQKSLETIEQIHDEFTESAEKLRFTPKWSGELYLEMHRGTYTTIAKNKKHNRQSELLYGDVEAICVADELLNKAPDYPYEMLDENWHILLKNQFHDIIPGSSIKEVYQVSDTEYDKILTDARNEFDKKLSSIAANINTVGGVLVYNPNAFTASSYVKYGNGEIYAENIPAYGWKVINPAKAEKETTAKDGVLENSVFKVTFDEKFNISSIIDKRCGRELVENGKSANVFELYEDYPREYDAWEITEYYKLKQWIIDDVSDVEYINEDTYSAVKIHRKYANSDFVQTIVLKAGSVRLDFNTEIDWHESFVLLKTAFPFNIHSEKATYEIACGHIERPTHRNTSWDEAKFEVPAHKWADLSEHGYGVSILNDCKYGYSTEENVMKLTFLKAPKYPNPEADMGKHTFTYSLYPHFGDLTDGGTVEQAFLLNNPMTAVNVPAQKGKLSDEYSLVSSSYDGFIVNAIKKPEDKNGVIIRGYEAYNGKSKVKLDFGFGVKKVYLCDLMENNLSEVETDGRSAEFDVGNFEIVTLRVIPE